MSRRIEILCPQTGLIKTVTVCEEQTIASLMGELGYVRQTLYYDCHQLDPESTFVGRLHNPSLFGGEDITLEPYRLGGLE